MKLPLKWKVYRFANYFLLLTFLFFFVLIVFFAIKEGLVKSDLPSFVPVLIGVFLGIACTFFNIYISYSHFPDKPLSGINKNMQPVFQVLLIIALIDLSIMCNWAFIEESKDSTDEGVVMLSVGIILLLVGYYIFYMQLYVKKFLQTNYNDRMTSMIENIGSD